MVVEDELARYAAPLPDGSAVLYTHFPSVEGAEVRLVDLATREVWTLVSPGSNASYVEPGYIVYGHGSQTIMAVPFDLGTREVTGPEGPVLPGVAVYSGGATQFAVSANGTALYLAGGGGTGQLTLSLVGLDGVVQELPVRPVPARPTPRFSPDGRYIAFDDQGQVHVFDQQLGTNAPLTFNTGDIYPTWIPGGTAVAYSDQGAISRVAADASGTPEVILEGVDLGGVFPHAWTSDEAILLFRVNTGSGNDLYTLDVATSTVRTYLQGEWNELAAALSPDERWVAYASDESGQYEIYVRSFPEPGARFQVSDNGGFEPVWAPDGRTLYYRVQDGLVAVSVSVEPGFSVLQRQRLPLDLGSMPSAGFSASYDIHPDGDRLVFFRGQNLGGTVEGDGAVFIVTNWFTELRERMGEGR
jgi:Tol biopolymer transport system component